MQAKLLRVLEDARGTARRLDRKPPGRRPVVAATNRKLERGRRRRPVPRGPLLPPQVYPLLVPPLRERPEDIPLLVDAPSRSSRREPRPRLTAEPLAALAAPPLARQRPRARQHVERAALLADNGTIDGSHITLSSAGGRALTGTLAPYRKAKTQFETAYYTQLLRTASGNISLAAKLAQKTRKEIYDALKRLDSTAPWATDRRESNAGAEIGTSRALRPLRMMTYARAGCQLQSLTETQ